MGQLWWVRALHLLYGSKLVQVFQVVLWMIKLIGLPVNILILIIGLIEPPWERLLLLKHPFLHLLHLMILIRRIKRQPHHWILQLPLHHFLLLISMCLIVLDYRALCLSMMVILRLFNLLRYTQKGILNVLLITLLLLQRRFLKTLLLYW